MNNMAIIANEAVTSGFYTKEKVIELIENGKDIPFHTFQYWKAKGVVPRKNEKGWPTKIWKKKVPKVKNSDIEEAGENGYFLSLCYLFDISQCEVIESK